MKLAEAERWAMALSISAAVVVLPSFDVGPAREPKPTIAPMALELLHHFTGASGERLDVGQWWMQPPEHQKRSGAGRIRGLRWS
ncbi:MAG: hypothetical protein D6723_02520 [Acidobacteria bacterium]|nr:MAG: hypothetical protein D6723_02520 [Acidobacteriota bacterium]